MDETCFVHFVPDVSLSRSKLAVIECLLCFIVRGTRSTPARFFCIVDDLGQKGRLGLLALRLIDLTMDAVQVHVGRRWHGVSHSLSFVLRLRVRGDHVSHPDRAVRIPPFHMIVTLAQDAVIDVAGFVQALRRDPPRANNVGTNCVERTALLRDGRLQDVHRLIQGVAASKVGGRLREHLTVQVLPWTFIHQFAELGAREPRHRFVSSSL